MLLTRIVWQSTGVHSWEYVQDDDENSLVDYTTFRNRSTSALVQISHSTSPGVTFSEGAGFAPRLLSHGETFPGEFRSVKSMAALKDGKGKAISQGIKAGRWQVSFHGPDVLVIHEDHPSQQLLLQGEGFLLLPSVPDCFHLLRLPPPSAIEVTPNKAARHVDRQTACSTFTPPKANEMCHFWDTLVF
eukprot:2273363-Rhodomonas_salina.2